MFLADCCDIEYVVSLLMEDGDTAINKEVLEATNELFLCYGHVSWIPTVD